MDKQKYYFTTLKVPTWHKPPRFKESRRFDWINYGEKNDYPDYLINLYNGSPTHQAIVSGKKDYIFGKGVAAEETSEALAMRFIAKANRFESLNQVMEKTILDYELFNGFALKIYQNIVTGKITEIYHADWATCRINEDASVIYTSNQWTEQQSLGTKYAGATRQPADLKEWPAFDVNIPQRESILYFREYSPQMKVYPLPGYLGCNAAIETEIEIGNFHLNNIKTGFSAGTMLTFTNGIPTVEEQGVIERQVKRKITGTDNAGEIILYFTNNTEHLPHILQLRPNEMDKQYEHLKQTVMDTIFVGHRVTSPMLFGVRTPGQLGGRNELREAYELFRNTYVNKRRQTIEQLLNSLAVVNGIHSKLTLASTEPIGIGFLLPGQDISECLTADEKRSYLARYGFPLENSAMVSEEKFRKYSFQSKGINLGWEDEKILMSVSANNHATIEQIANACFLEETEVLTRLDKLEAEGVITCGPEIYNGQTVIVRTIN
ncbi:MAG TPA: winged helix-turn-helix domain-containing protein [Bacteroidia bacterium]|nr:winged helix-turn-helix domain-containing protein [Bacteroidia bacterium]